MVKFAHKSEKNNFPMTLFKEICNNIQPVYADEHERQAVVMLLLDKMLGWDRMACLLNGRESVNPSLMSEVDAMVNRIAQGEPIQYVVGVAEFCGQDFRVAPGVLIPRPETEELVDWVVKDNSDCGNGIKSILDIGTGSGCIAVSLARKIPQTAVSAWDISQEALDIARQNAVEHGVEVSFSEIDVLASFDFEASDDDCYDKRVFDVIVSNPPYICQEEAEEMETKVLDYEPHVALFVPDDDPLLFYRRIAVLGKSLLKRGGRIYFEINRRFADDTVLMMNGLGYKTMVRKDAYGNDRMVRGVLIH